MNLERETADESGEAVALALDRYRQGLTGFTPLADAQLTWLEYRNALLTSQSKALVALVNLYQAPDGGRSEFQYTLVAQGRLEDASQFGDIILRQDAGGILRLKDVAKVELGSQSYGAVAKVNGQPTALVGVQQLPGANALDVAKGAEKELERLSRYFPDGVHYRIVQNVSDYVRESIDDVLVTFVLTTLILMFVILIFLQNWRAVIIPMLTIPVSIIATFAVMKLMGFSLNTLTLSGLVLAIAIVVDDAIVVVEDCSRLVDKGELDRKQAAAKAMKELTGPVIGEVLVLMSVFIPTAFVSGITGELYKQFALTIAVSTAFSGFNALTLTPVLCVLFLTPRKPARFVVYKLFKKGYDRVLHFYDRVITGMLGRPRLMLLIYVVVAAVGIWGFTKWPSSYLPEEDMGYFLTSVQLPTGASLQRTEAVVDGISQRIPKEVPQVKDVMSISGFSFMGGGVRLQHGLDQRDAQAVERAGARRLYRRGDCQGAEDSLGVSGGDSILDESPVDTRSWRIVGSDHASSRHQQPRHHGDNEGTRRRGAGRQGRSAHCRRVKPVPGDSAAVSATHGPE